MYLGSRVSCPRGVVCLCVQSIILLCTCIKTNRRLRIEHHKESKGNNHNMITQLFFSFLSPGRHWYMTCISQFSSLLKAFRYLHRSFWSYAPLIYKAAPEIRPQENYYTVSIRLPISKISSGKFSREIWYVSRRWGFHRETTWEAAVQHLSLLSVAAQGTCEGDSGASPSPLQLAWCFSQLFAFSWLFGLE